MHVESRILFQDVITSVAGECTPQRWALPHRVTSLPGEFEVFFNTPINPYYKLLGNFGVLKKKICKNYSWLTEFFILCAIFLNFQFVITFYKVLENILLKKNNNKIGKVVIKLWRTKENMDSFIYK